MRACNRFNTNCTAPDACQGTRRGPRPIKAFLIGSLDLQVCSLDIVYILIYKITQKKIMIWQIDYSCHKETENR